MGSGGGGGGIDLGEIGNILTNTLSMGLAGYKDGKFEEGFLSEGIGELTGRNTAREALYQQNVQIDKEVQRRQQEMTDQVERQRQNELQGSQAAGRTNSPTPGTKRSFTNGTTIDMERDFLGL